jgi:hypothetical protein
VPGDFVLLSLDAAKVGAEVKYEAAAPVGDTPPPEGAPLFPHLVRPRLPLRCAGASANVPICFVRSLLRIVLCACNLASDRRSAAPQYGPILESAVTEETSVDRTPSGTFLGFLWGVSVIHSRADWIKLDVGPGPASATGAGAPHGGGSTAGKGGSGGGGGCGCFGGSRRQRADADGSGAAVVSTGVN